MMREMAANDFFRLSYSKIACYQRCRKQYWFKYVSGQQWPPQVDSPASLIGTAVHRAMRVLSESGDVDSARHELDAYTRMPSHQMIAAPSEHYDTAFRLLDIGIAAHLSIESENRWAELSSYTPWPARGITVTTIIDRADRISPTEYQLIDWKTGRGDFGEAIDLQLDIAHVVLRKARMLQRDANVTTIGWNLRTGERRVRPLTRDDAAATLKYLAALADAMRATTEFEATPSPACSFCDWRDQCPEAATIVDESDLLLEADLEPGGGE